MAALILTTVVDGLTDAGIPAQAAYPGAAMPNITEPQAAVSLEKLEYTARSATVLVTVMVPVSMGGAACEESAIQVGSVLENLGGVCIQEECRFNSYADAFYVRVLGTFYGSDVMAGWNAASDFTVKLGSQVLKNAVAFQAEQAVDAVTGTPLSTSVWTFRLEESYGRGEGPLPPPAEPFQVTVTRSSGIEQYNDCTWVSVQIENTATGLRQIRTGVAKTRGILIVV